MQKTTEYIGNELEVFSKANNWKSYWGSKINPYLGKNVLEVGAGIGSNTGSIISNDRVEKCICIEPDENLSREIKPRLANKKGIEKVEVITSFLSDYKTTVKFDSILYIDVIEHIENDKEEVLLATSFLKDGGYLMILVPAYNFLYNDFDKAIGHFRRYNRQTLKNVVPPNMKIVSQLSLDSLGLFASAANKILLRQSYPTETQINFWDTFIIPISKFTDKLLLHKAGKSILMVCKKIP